MNVINYAHIVHLQFRVYMYKNTFFISDHISKFFGILIVQGVSEKLYEYIWVYCKNILKISL